MRGLDVCIRLRIRGRVFACGFAFVRGFGTFVCRVMFKVF